jgi:thymidine phosphorylase
MLLLAGVASDLESAHGTLVRLWRDGVVRQVFRHNLELQGGDPRVLDDVSLLGIAPHVVAVEAPRAGFVVDVDPLALGHVVVDLGGGRRQPVDAIDPQVGIVLKHTLGDAVQAGDVLAFVHARTAAMAQQASARVGAAMPVGDERRRRGSLVKRRLA